VGLKLNLVSEWGNSEGGRGCVVCSS